MVYKKKITVIAVVLSILIFIMGIAIYSSNILQKKSHEIIERNIYINGLDKNLIVPVPEEYENLDSSEVIEMYLPLMDFYREDVQEYFDYEYSEIRYLTPRYLSIESRYNSNEKYRFGVGFTVCLTIDRESQQIMLLDDFVEINDEFITLLARG